jgi:VHL beta domain
MRLLVIASVFLACACPPGLGAKTVSCVPDGGLLGCFEWSGADLPALGAIDLTCTQLGSMSRPEACPVSLRVTGCRVERSAFVETRWYRAGTGGEVLTDCADAGKLVVYADDERDAGVVEPLSDAGMRCSVAGGATSVITFLNVSSEPIVPSWVSPGTCAEISYAPIAPGAGVNQPTFIGHVWRFRRGVAGGPLLREYTVEAVNASVAIR